MTTLSEKIESESFFARQIAGGEPLRVVLAETALAILAEAEGNRHYHESYIKQANDTLATILKVRGVTHDHNECGVICKINEIEGLLEDQAK